MPPYPAQRGVVCLEQTCAFSADGVTHLVLIKDSATSQSLPRAFHPLEQVKGTSREKWWEGRQ